MITSPPRGPHPSNSGGWDLEEFLDNSADQLGFIFGGMLILIGIVGIIWSGTLLLKKLMSGHQDQTSWGQIIMLIVVGGLCLIVGATPSLYGDEGDEADEPAPATDPEPEPEPAPEPTRLEVDPSVFIAVGASLVGLAAAAFLWWFIANQRRKRKEAAAEAERIRDEFVKRWKLARDEHQANINTVGSYVTDIAKAIDYPAFNDVNVPEVSAMTKAMSAAKRVEVRFNDTKDEPIPSEDKDLLVEYEQAVAEFSSKLAEAEAAAERIRWSEIPKEERDLMKQIKNLLIQAEDKGNPEQMRHNLYQRIQKLVDRLNEDHGRTYGRKLLTDGSVDRIEQQTRLLLEAPEKVEPLMTHQFQPEHFYDGIAEKVATAPKSAHKKFSSLFAKQKS